MDRILDFPDLKLEFQGDGTMIFPINQISKLIIINTYYRGLVSQSYISTIYLRRMTLIRINIYISNP